MFGKISSLFRYVIIGVFILILFSSLLDSVLVVVIQTREGNYLPIILIIFISTVSLRIAHTNRAQNIPSTILWAVGWLPAIYFCSIVFFFLYSPATMFNAILGGGVAFLCCKSYYEIPDLRIKIAYLFASTKASMSSIAIGYNSAKNSIWTSATGSQSQLFIVPQESRESILYLMKERPTLPISYTHLEDFDYISILKENGWSERIRNLMSNLDIGGLKSVPPLLEKGARVLPLLLQDQIDSKIEYGITSDVSSADIMIKDWPVGITIFPGKNGLRVVAPLNKVLGLDLHHLSKIDAFRILIDRDPKAFPQGGIENVNSS